MKNDMSTERKKISEISEKSEKDLNKDLIATLDAVVELNKRLHNLELKHNEYVKFSNLTTNTVNYILAALYTYESYIKDMGIDAEELKRDIEHTYYTVFNNKSLDKSSNIVKKVSDKLREFQEKFNQLG